MRAQGNLRRMPFQWIHVVEPDKPLVLGWWVWSNFYGIPPISLWLMVLITIVNGAYKPNYNWWTPQFGFCLAIKSWRKWRKWRTDRFQIWADCGWQRPLGFIESMMIDLFFCHYGCNWRFRAFFRTKSQNYINQHLNIRIFRYTNRYFRLPPGSLPLPYINHDNLQSTSDWFILTIFSSKLSSWAPRKKRPTIPAWRWMCWTWHHHMGVSENSVPLNPMVLLIITPIKWLIIGNIPNIFRQTHILSVPLPSGSFKRRPARSWCQCAATKSFVVRCDGRCTTWPCFNEEQLIAGAVHHWEKPSTKWYLFTRETNHWFPLLICWYNHWYTLLTLCSVGKTIFENHERGKDQEIAPTGVVKCPMTWEYWTSPKIVTI